MIRSALASSLLLVTSLFAVPASAQKFVNYVCDDGTQVTVAFFRAIAKMRMQAGGRSFSLPKRLSASGARYAKGGVSFWIKGQQATLKTPNRKTTTCQAQ